MSRPARTRPASGTLLELIRGGYGALQLAAPALVADHLLSRPLEARARAVARVLGARQLVQAVASGGTPSYPVLALGVEVDLLHAASMLVVAARQRRSTALLDALIAASFAVAGTLVARTSATGQLPAPTNPLDALRQRCAGALARTLVPGSTTLSAASDGRGGRHLTGSRQGTLLSPGSSEKR